MIGLLLPKYLGFDHIGFRTVGFIAVVLLFNAIATLLMFFDIGAEMEVSLSQSDVCLSGHDLKRSLLNRYLQCYVATENRTDYLADMYKAARFCFMSAFVLVAVLVSISLLTNTSTSTSEKLAIQLRSDPSLVNLLKGPKEVQGEKRGPGKDGRIGSQGVKGEKEDQAVFDYEMLVTRLLSDPKFKSAVENVLKMQANQPTNP